MAHRTVPTLRLVLVASALGLGSGCIAHNQFGREVRIERGSYLSQGEQLDYLVGVPEGAPESAPLAVFLEGDGSLCQSYGDGAWRRFLVRRTGSALLVRPRTFVNTVCGTQRFAQADFLHRVAELERLLEALRRDWPGRSVFLVGHSAGAHVAVLYASAHPGEIAGIANLGGGTWPLSEVLPEIVREKERRGELSREAAEERLAELERLAARLRASPDSSEPMWGRTMRFWSQMFFSGVRERWAAAELPVLVLHGTEDVDAVPASAVRQAEEALARAERKSVRFVFLDGEGHDLLGAKAFALVEEWMQAVLRARVPTAQPPFSGRIESSPTRPPMSGPEGS